MLLAIVVVSAIFAAVRAQYTAAAVIALAKEVYDENFARTIIGDCDFGGANPLVMCPRPMVKGCTMGQMFLGVPTECGGTTPRFRDASGMVPTPYKEIWGISYSPINAMRATGYLKGTNDGIMEAGLEPLKKAKADSPFPKTQGKKWGVGVCTTLAAAGLTAIAEKMNADKATWGGTRILHMREAYATDGHEYLFITDATDKNKVLVDYWYSAIDGSTTGNIITFEEANGKKRWNLNKAFVAKDHHGASNANGMRVHSDAKDRIYVVPAAAVAVAHVSDGFDDALYGAYNDFLSYETAVDNLLRAQEEFEVAQQSRMLNHGQSRMNHGQSRKIKRRRVSRTNH